MSRESSSVSAIEAEPLNVGGCSANSRVYIVHSLLDQTAMQSDAMYNSMYDRCGVATSRTAPAECSQSNCRPPQHQFSVVVVVVVVVGMRPELQPSLARLTQPNATRRCRTMQITLDAPQSPTYDDHITASQQPGG